MISYSDVEHLEGEQQERIGALFERSDEIWDLPDDLRKIEAWDEFIEDCERAEFPHLAASARFGQSTTYAMAGMTAEAVEAYVRLMQLIHRQGEYIAPPNVQRFLGQVYMIVDSMVEDPDIPLAKMQQMTDLVEEATRRFGGDIAGIYLARAMAAEAAGDAQATFEWMNRWQAEGSEEWRTDEPSVVQIEIPLVARFDPAGAASLLEQRFAGFGLDPRRIDPERPEIQLRALLGALYARTGRRHDADAIADQLLEAFDAEELARTAVLHDLIPVLENRPEAALVAVDFGLENEEFDFRDWEHVAATARSRILADPEGEEGRLLQALVEQAVEAQDRRGGTDVHGRLLQDFWWQGLPPGPRPAAVDDPAIWSDREDRAEYILAAGWLQRVEAVNIDNPPIGIKDRYVEIGHEAAIAILEAETPEEADALEERIYARGEQLRFPLARFGARLMRGLKAGQDEDPIGFADGYERAQAELLANYRWLDEGMRRAAEGLYATVVQIMVAEPAISWDRIDAVMRTEAAVREQTGAPVTPLYQARAEVAAHLGDGQELQQLIRTLIDRLGEEEDRLDRVTVELGMIRLTAPYALDFARQVAEWVAQVGDLEQQRSATAWLCWMRNSAGDPEAAGRMLALLEEVDRDLEALAFVPHWVVLEAVASRGADILWLVDKVIEEADAESGSDLQSTATAASALLALAPDDPRGPELRDTALRVAGRLDERNENSHWSTLLRNRWFRGGVG
ncbi:hypothetical protein [Gulosibacter sp. 10]|uniref:hypothetical protein n=1 Tax=Gulosibacter sp. 10 TaxID=1255570 RepID=UPI00097E9ABA|nr:hypothetical protein [Gulosibacter sp. 10]SJM63219.1 hypothetical protein FM112_09035 [Gulosibacter sp. 10]